MRVRLTIEVGPEERAGISARTGREHLATNAEVREWALSLIEAHYPDLRWQAGYERDDEDEDDQR